jgi:diacylglycerol kinase
MYYRMMKNAFSKSLIVAFKGIAQAISSERNIKIQIIIGLLIIGLSLFLRIPKLEFLIILFTCFLVIILELINTSVERLLDKLHPGFDKEIGKVKDILAGAVLLSVLLSIIIGIVILLEPLIAFLF